MSTNRSRKFLVSALGFGVGLGLVSMGANAAPPAGVQAGGQMGEILAKLDQLSAKLDRVEKRLGCPIDEYVAGTCTDNPAGVSVTYCISQGRSGEIAGKWAVEPKAKVEAGVSWDVALLGRLKGDLNFPLFAPLPLPPIPIPTELAIGGSASLGRGFDICVEIPLRAAAADATILNSIVKGMNPSTLDTKFQRRLTRLLNYADRRVPAPVTSNSVKSVVLAGDAFDLDVLDDAMERFNAGAFQPPNGPLGLLKDPVIQDLRNALELPEPVQMVLDDPDILFEFMPTANATNPAQMCDKLNLSGAIANRAPAIRNLCNLLGSVPSFEVASGAFGTVHQIKTLLADLPDEIIFGVGDILPNVNTPKLPAPRPPGSTVCNIFPRLCR